MLKGRLAVASLIVILLPYAAVSYLAVAVPPSSEAYFSTSSVHADCSRYTGRTLQVSPGSPGQYSTISAAVQAAMPRDTIMVHQGVYREAVNVTVPCLTITGTDRKTTILDGGNSLENGIEVSHAPGVTVANLTTRDYAYNGVYFEMSNDWAIKGVRSLNDGHYGMYAVASTYGVMSDDFAMGNGDSGFYIGAVPDCSCVIENSTAYGNVLGYSGTVANGVTIRDSRFINNSVGIGPNTLLPDWSVFLSGDWKLPLTAANHTIENNLVEDNNNATVIGEGISQTYGVPIGTGIFMTGASQSLIRNNTITGNKLWGIGEFTFLNIPVGNRYIGNIFSSNGQDFFTDGTGFFGCSSGESATGAVPPSCDTPAWLRLTVPNPYNELVLMLSVGKPGLAGDIVLGVPFLFFGTASSAKQGMTTTRRRRLGSSIIDLLVAGDIYLFIMALVAVLGFGAATPADLANLLTSVTLLLSPLAYFILVTTWFIYGFLMEGFSGRTAGKWILGLRLTRSDGSKANFRRSFIKNILVFADTLFFGLPGIVLLMMKRRTLGEIVSGTVTTRE